MSEEALVIIYTQVYNTKPYLDQCVSSVLAQTYKNFKYRILDNGSTDGSITLLEQYAAQDERIELIRQEENRRFPYFEYWGDPEPGTFFTILDSDDWWEPNYLEKLMKFQKDNDLDIAITGTVNYFEAVQQERLMRKSNQPVVFSLEIFAQHYPDLWMFPSTQWGSVMKAEIFRREYINDLLEKTFSYGKDTLMMLRVLDRCQRIGIDDSVLYHYRIHNNSISTTYKSNRFEGDLAYYQNIRDFLEKHRALDPAKDEWLKRVHIVSLKKTMKVLLNAKLLPKDKLSECAQIASHPLTKYVLETKCEERNEWFAIASAITEKSLQEGRAADAEPMKQVLELLSPDCYRSLSAENMPLFAKNPLLRKALMQNSRQEMQRQLLDWIRQKRFAKQFDLGKMLAGLIPEDSLLYGIEDTYFFRTYADACMKVLQQGSDQESWADDPEVQEMLQAMKDLEK